MKIGFDNDQYLKTQSARIRERIASFGGKLYLEFGGKIFDDYHASRVLPGFLPDSKMKMLLELKDDAEIIIAINANDIEKCKIRGDIGIPYEQDILRLIDTYRSFELPVCGVVMTQYGAQPSAVAFEERLQKLGVRVYRHYTIEGYPANIPVIVSDNGFGKNDFIETSRSLVVVTAPGPGSGKMAVCLSQLYHEHKRGVQAGYAKFETFPIWNLPLKHPVNLAYEAATTDLNDVNMIDPFHLEAYGETTVNYNRDIEIFPVLNTIFENIFGQSPYKSPTDMGVNMAGNCIIDDDVVCEASRQEVIRRYYKALVAAQNGETVQNEIRSLELLMKQSGVTPNGYGIARRQHRGRQDQRPFGRVLGAAFERAEETGEYPQRYRPRFARGHRADPGSENQSSRQQKSASAHRRGAFGALNLGGDQSDRRARHGCTPAFAGQQSALHRHLIGGRSAYLCKIRRTRHLRAETANAHIVSQIMQSVF